MRTLSAADADAPPGAAAADLADVLFEAGVAPSATHVTVLSDDGLYSASIPLNEATAKGRLFVGIDSTLDRSLGGPFRLTVPDGRTLCWNVKAVGELRFTEGPEPDSVPENPTH